MKLTNEVKVGVTMNNIEKNGIQAAELEFKRLVRMVEELGVNAKREIAAGVSKTFDNI